MNIVDVIREETTNYQRKTAVIDGGSRISYAELFAGVDELADELRKCGVQPAQRVALLCSDSIYYIVVSLAVLSLRAVIVPVSLFLSRTEVSAILERIDINFLIFEKEVYFQNNALRIFSRSIDDKEFFLHRCLAREEFPDDYYVLNAAFIRFSSGTTGTNKGVLLSHEAIIQRTDAADRGLKVTSNDIVLWVLSMSFHFVVTILLFLRRAATIILCARRFPEALLENLKLHKATFIYASPFHYHMLTKSDMFMPELFSDVRIAVSTAMKLSKSEADDFYKKFGFELSEAYGIIEVGLPFINCSGDKTKRGSVGKILPDYTAKIVNADSRGVGKIILGGKGMFDAYFSPWRLKQQAAPEGWFNTGDLGRFDEDDFLFLVGRQSNVINFAGMKIFPYEVESVLNRHPAVKESLVYGVPHASYGQLPSARVILQDNLEGEFDIDEVRKFCYQHLASYKVPKEFFCVSQLEKTLSGKLKR